MAEQPTKHLLKVPSCWECGHRVLFHRDGTFPVGATSLSSRQSLGGGDGGGGGLIDPAIWLLRARRRLGCDVFPTATVTSCKIYTSTELQRLSDCNSGCLAAK